MGPRESILSDFACCHVLHVARNFVICLMADPGVALRLRESLKGISRGILGGIECGEEACEACCEEC